MKIRIKVATEESELTPTSFLEALLQKVEDCRSFQELQDLQFSNGFNYIKNDPPIDSYYNWLGFPLSNSSYILFMFFVDSTTYDVVMSEPTIEKTNRLPTTTATINALVHGNYYKYSTQEKADAIATVDGQAAVVGLSDSQIESEFDSDPERYAVGGGLFILLDEYIEPLFEDIKDKLKEVLQTQISMSQASVPEASPKVTSSSNLPGLSAILRAMRVSGGEITFLGLTGLPVEIYYDYTAHKYRVRTNDGIHGLANVAFPNAHRTDNAVFIVPKNLVTWNGKNYRIGNNLDFARLRVR